MAATTGSFADGVIARLIALIIAAVIALFLITEWGDEMKALFSASGESAMMSEPAVTEASTNPALEACLEKRIGDVEQMKADGVINDAQYTEFRARAEALCYAQNTN